jgi:hypothetical protein
LLNPAENEPSGQGSPEGDAAGANDPAPIQPASGGLTPDQALKLRVVNPACGEDVIIMLKGKNAVIKRVSELPQSMKFENRWVA